MKNSSKPFDKYFFLIVLFISIIGILSFVSASLGILARSEEKFYGVLLNQIVFGFVGGLIALYLVSKINFDFWKKYSFYIFIFSLGLTLLVFVPGLGFSHGGASRWLDIGPFSFQPAEVLKIGFIIYFSAWLAWVQKQESEVKYKIIPFIILFGIVAITLLKQPDTKSLILIGISSFAIMFVSGVSWKKIFGMFAILAIGAGILIYARPYVMDRVKTFIDPSRDPLGKGYQIQQSFIAIGSGQVIGRGLGQSIQKFNYLPEPQGDSIFAVFAEEFGFIGSVILVVLYVFLGLRGYKIAMRAPDVFSKYLVIGLVSLIFFQSFLNIGALVGILPLTGVPLVFVSHGGSALMLSLISAGIILNVSRHKKGYNKAS